MGGADAATATDPVKGPGHNLIHRAVTRIGDEDVPVPVHRHAIGEAETEPATHVVDRGSLPLTVPLAAPPVPDTISFTPMIGPATKTLPLPSTATLKGKRNPLLKVLTVELELTVPLAAPPVPATISSTVLLPASVTKTFPLPSTATPVGPLKPLPTVVTVELELLFAAGARHNLLHRTVVVIGDEDVPAAVHSHAKGPLKPLPRGSTTEVLVTTPPAPATISFTTLFSKSATKTFTLPSTATPSGLVETVAHGIDRGAGVDRAACCAAGTCQQSQYTALLGPDRRAKTFPLLSTATPEGMGEAVAHGG